MGLRHRGVGAGKGNSVRRTLTTGLDAALTKTGRGEAAVTNAAPGRDMFSHGGSTLEATSELCIAGLLKALGWMLSGFRNDGRPLELLVDFRLRR